MGLCQKLGIMFENYKDKIVCRHGRHIATIINLEPDEIDNATKLSSNQSGHKISWYYSAGHAVLKTFGNIDTAQYYLKQNLDLCGRENYCVFE